MKPAPFQYHRPGNLEELCDLLNAFDNAKILAGGQSLVPMLNMRFAQPDHIIDINRIPDLSEIRLDDDYLEIGALTRQADVIASPLVARSAPLLAEALHHTGHMQTRSRGTIGGSLCHLDPAAETPACMLALDATLVVRNAEGERLVEIEDWFLGYLTPNIEPNEVLCAIRVKPWHRGHGYAFLEFARRRGDFALASAACLLTAGQDGAFDRVRLIVSGLDTRPVRCVEAESLLIGRKADDALFETAAATVHSFDVLEDAYGDAAYRQRLAATLVVRALKQASEQLLAGGHD